MGGVETVLMHNTCHRTADHRGLGRRRRVAARTAPDDPPGTCKRDVAGRVSDELSDNGYLRRWTTTDVPGLSAQLSMPPHRGQPSLIIRFGKKLPAGTSSWSLAREAVLGPCAEVSDMTSIVSAIIAVVGTLLGATTTYVFQRIDAIRKDRIARNERFRQERLAVYTELAAAVTDLRRAAHDRWHRHQEDPDGPAFAAARDHYYRVYAVARNVQLKLRLLADDTDLVEVAQQAWERAAEIKDADEEQERRWKGEQAKQALDAFILAASRRLR
jgi:hypothetical protein